MIASKLASLEQYQSRLLEELEDSARQVLDILSHLKTLEPNSEAFGDAQGRLYAYTLQLELDAADVRKVMDEISAALPEEVEE